jgi:hypothetical protein
MLGPATQGVWGAAEGHKRKNKMAPDEVTNALNGYLAKCAGCVTEGEHKGEGLALRRQGQRGQHCGLRMRTTFSCGRGLPAVFGVHLSAVLAAAQPLSTCPRLL